ncbi:MAG: J domain-containing protein [Nitrospirae bacterium]|nr:J domain-containing protein [Nitrospirota bacterium]
MGGDNFYKSRAVLRDLIESLIRKSMAGMDLAMDRMFALQPETYLRYEERFSELARLLECLQDELGSADNWRALDRIQRRVYFLEERFEDIDSVLRKRPRRSRSRFSMDNLFRVSQGGGSGSRSSSGSEGDALSIEEACEVLGIEISAKLPEIRKKFRSLMKELHPDIRMGDRSKESQIRKVLAAYEVLKQKHVLS